jgi:hypothetical protein
MQKSNNMLTPSKQCSLAFLSLLSTQKELAAGRFSALQAPTNDDTDCVSSYFDRDMTTTTRKFILGTSSLILFLENRVFKVISSPSMTISCDSRQTITGHFGDKLLHPNPISISGDAATLDVLVVAKKSIDGTSVLDALMATTNSVTVTIVSEDPDTTPITFPFPQMGADEDPMVTFENYYISRLPVAVPLPMGHGIDPVSIDDEEAIEPFFVKPSFHFSLPPRVGPSHDQNSRLLGRFVPQRQQPWYPGRVFGRTHRTESHAGNHLHQVNDG